MAADGVESRILIASATNKVLIHDVDSSQQPISIIKEFTKSQEQPSGVVLSMSWSDDNQIVTYCLEGSNKLYFSRSDTGSLIKSYSICDEV